MNTIKKYFLIAVVGVLIWACKYNLGPGALAFCVRAEHLPMV